MKKHLFFVWLLIILIAFSGCTITSNVQPGASTTEQNTTKEPEIKDKGILFDEPVSLKIMFSSHASWPFNEDWWVIDAIKEATNVIYDPIPVLDDFNTKFNITMASGELPDIIYGSQSQANEYYADGPFISMTDYIDKMPNAKKLIESDENFAYKMDLFKMPDGKVYLFPYTGNEILVNKRGWLARLDILEEQGLEVPRTDEELYLVLKALKDAYPDSFPLSYRLGVGQFQIIGPNYGTDLYPFYDYKSESWKYGPVTDEFKTMVTFYNKLYKEGLIPPDILTLSTQGWTDMMSTSKSFFTVDYINRIDFFNGPLRKEDPDANLQFIHPPKGSVLEEDDKTGFKSGLYTKGIIACNTDKKDKAVQFIDWLYSDEASVLVSWGKEGETFKVENGKRQYLGLKEGERIEQLYGFMTDGTALRVEVDSQTGMFSDDVAKAFFESGKTEQDKFNPYLWLSLNVDESEVRQTIGSAIDSHAKENISKFMIGQRDLSEWDAYVDEIRRLGLDDFLKIYEDAYGRTK